MKPLGQVGANIRTFIRHKDRQYKIETGRHVTNFCFCH